MAENKNIINIVPNKDNEAQITLYGTTYTIKVVKEDPKKTEKA